MKDRVLVTGAAGFIGRAVVDRLKAMGYPVLALVRQESDAKVLAGNGVTVTVGDVLCDDALITALSGKPAAVIQLVGRHISVEATARVLAFAERSEVRRYVHMSALGAAQDSRCRYHRRKWVAEELVRNSAMAWTIFRPSVVFGERCDFVKSLELLVRTGPIIPIPGPGRCLLQPIHVEDVAMAVVKSLDLDRDAGKTYHLGGPETWALNEIIGLVERRLGFRKRRVHFPLGLGRVLIAIQEHPLLGKPLRQLYGDITPDRRLNREHLELLREDNVCPNQTEDWARAMTLTFLEDWLNTRNLPPRSGQSEFILGGSR